MKAVKAQGNKGEMGPRGKHLGSVEEFVSGISQRICIFGPSFFQDCNILQYIAVTLQ